MSLEEIWNQLSLEAKSLWIDIGERLVVGQKRYGGFKFSEYDLDKMALEEIEDFIVYIVAKKYLKKVVHEARKNG